MIYNSKNQLTKRVNKEDIRGYTNHRQLYTLNLIDMGGRMYDTTISRFLSIDPHLQDPTNPQNYNRYIYVLNNPLRYTDPSGYNWDDEHNYDASQSSYDAGAASDAQAQENDEQRDSGYNGGDGSASQTTTPVSVFNPPKSTTPKPTTKAYVQNTKNLKTQEKKGFWGGLWGGVSKSVSYIGGALQVATGVTMMATIGWTGVGFYAGATIAGLGVNNIQSTWTGDTTVKDFVNETTGWKHAYTAIDMGTSFASLTRIAGVKSAQYFARGFGEIEMTRHAYAYEEMGKGALFFEGINTVNSSIPNGENR